jgi:two-component system chemotaxis response regulator CheB
MMIGGQAPRENGDAFAERDASLDGPATDVVVVGASAGGVEALQSLVAGLPADLSAAILVVLHLPRQGPRALAAILDRAGPLSAVEAQPGRRLEPGTIFVAPPDHHLVIDRGGQHVRLTTDPPERGHRPSVDVLFRSAVAAVPARIVGVVLSGAGDDGAEGLVSAVSAGAIAIVQDPDQAAYPSMPRRAAEEVPTALVRRTEEMGSLIGELLKSRDAPVPVRSPPVDGLNGALWLAVRALQDRAMSKRHLAAAKQRTGDDAAAGRYTDQADEADQAVATIRRFLRLDSA